MSIIAATTVIRGSQRGDSHGAFYLVDTENGRGAQLLDWARPAIDWSGRDGGRGLRGLAFYEGLVWIAGATELLRFTPALELQGALRSSYLGDVQALACFDGRLYVASAAYDSVLALDLQTGRFDWGLQISDGDAGLRGLPFDPSGALGPSPSSALGLNSLHCSAQGLFIGGAGTLGLLHFDGKRIVRLVTLPGGVHDARPWRNGVLFNDTEADAVRFLTPDANCVFEVPHYPEEELEFPSFEDQATARQGFGRGLCVLETGHFASGSSPLTISLHDLDEMKTTLRINLSTDARHAIHTLAVWPFEPPET
jgi:hypothetical protein